MSLHPPSPLVLGTLGIGSNFGQKSGYRPITDEEAFSVLDEIWRMGIRLADTAPSYGSRCAIRRLAAWQALTGHTLKIVAKLGRPLVDGQIVPNYDASALLRELEEYDVMGLRVETVLIKDPPSADLRSGRWEEYLTPLLQERPSLSYGFSSHDHGACAHLPKPSSSIIAQIEANAVNWQLAGPIAQHLNDLGTEVWAMQPLDAGFLTAETRLVDTIHPEDWRRTLPDDLLDARQARSHVVAKTLSRAAPGLSVAAAAFVFLLSQPSIGRIVIGPRKVWHLDAVQEAITLSGSTLSTPQIAIKATS